MGVNIARAIGPALAGFMISAVALSSPFVVNAASYLAIVTALLLWKPEIGPAQTLPPEPLFGALTTGLRHASRSSALKATMIRSFGFFTFASAYWALLPLVARGIEGGGAEMYGVLLAAIGGGAVAGALALPNTRKRIDANHLVALGTLSSAAAMALLGSASSVVMALPASVLGGLGWITVLTSLNVSAQTALPDWVRARTSHRAYGLFLITTDARQQPNPQSRADTGVSVPPSSGGEIGICGELAEGEGLRSNVLHFSTD